MVNSFPQQIKDLNPQIQETNENKQKSILYIIQIYYTETEVQEKKEVLKTTQVKGQITYKEMTCRLIDDFSIAQMKLEDNTFKMLRENNYSPKW